MKESGEHVVERLNLVSCKVAAKIKSDEFGSSIGIVYSVTMQNVTMHFLRPNFHSLGDSIPRNIILQSFWQCVE